jgi:DNA-binding HxlR family transcriptional regulator
MPRREYGQECSLACALDAIGERWSLLIVRELSLGPLRFSELARAVGGAPTDVLTKRLRGLEGDGIVARRGLDPPAAAVAYELTEFGRGLERPMLELGRWGMGLQTVEDFTDLTPGSLPNAVRVVLRPPPDFELTLGLRSGSHAYLLHFEAGWIAARRGAGAADLALSGEPLDLMAALVVGEPAEVQVEIEGDRNALESLRAMVSVPLPLRKEATASFANVEPVGQG